MSLAVTSSIFSIHLLDHLTSSSPCSSLTFYLNQYIFFSFSLSTSFSSLLSLYFFTILSLLLTFVSGFVIVNYKITRGPNNGATRSATLIDLPLSFVFLALFVIYCDISFDSYVLTLYWCAPFLSLTLDANHSTSVNNNRSSQWRRSNLQHFKLSVQSSFYYFRKIDFIVTFNQRTKSK